MVAGPYTELEIAASPEAVRSIFLGDTLYKEWNPYFMFPSIGKPATDLTAGEKLEVHLKGKPYTMTIIENSPAAFVWLGGVPGIVNGVHGFHFGNSERTSGGTTFVQKEEFGGFLGWLLKRLLNQDNLKAQFEEFNNALKSVVEGRK
ncbi:hypothetical protein K504DRAFT_532779 [Pleomassaria siparia CBS 279.74]|uniref:SRPBCC domain-containing protein n=1 Tax=Pleomassaria siparia CBS 279.74 TaxID=1314801 RepID=A0A6G1KF23_9PLEO|nr:hypothetical protein K504DRAFT_532779 [Pleomassaria siparia CBS 279.74]